MINGSTKDNNKYQMNTLIIPRRHKSPVIYDLGVNNYVFNEIKKAKYQGAFDPGSIGNKNIFLDSNKTNNKNNSGINQQKSKKNKVHYNKVGEGKNLLIIKSETQYPLNYQYDTVSPDLNYHQNPEKNIYNFNNYYIETRNNNYRNIFSRSNDNKRSYFSPSNKERQKSYLLQNNNNYLTKTINIEKLNKDFDKRFKESKRTLYEKYATNTISFNNPINNYSPTLAPKRKPNLVKHNTNYINMSYSKKFNSMTKDRNEIINNTYTYDDENNFDNYILYDNSIDRIDLQKDKEKIDFYRQKLLNLFFWHIKNFYKLHFKSLFNEIINILRSSINNKEHNFENKSIKNIAGLKKEVKNNSYYYGQNGKYNNLLKEVKIKNNINNVLVENSNNNNDLNIANPKFLKTENNNIINNYDKKDYNKNDMNNKISSRNKVINKKKFIGNISNLNATYNTKYIKKKVSQGIYGKKIISQKFNNKLKLFDTNIKKDEKNDINNDIIQNETNKKIKNTPIIKKRLKFSKSFISEDKKLNSEVKFIDSICINKNNINNNIDKNIIIDNINNIDNNYNNIGDNNNINNDNIINNYNNKDDDNYNINNDNNINNYNKIDDNNNINNDNNINNYNNIGDNNLNNNNNINNYNNNINDKINDNNNNFDNFNKEDNNDINNNIDNYNNIQENIIDNKYNIDNLSIKSNEEKLFENNIDKIATINYKNIKNNNENDINQNEENNSKDLALNNIENYSNKNLENAISLITKVIENKEKDDKEKKISILIKIINNKINKDKEKNSEIMQRFFKILKQTKSLNLKEEEKKHHKKLNKAKDLIKKSKLKRNQKLKKNLVLSDLEDTKENLDLSLEKNLYKSEDDDKDRNKRNKNKIRVIIKQIKMQKNINNNYQYDYYRPKTPSKNNNNNKSSKLEINNKTPKIIVKKTLNIIVVKNKEYNNNIKKDEIEKELNVANNHIKSNEKELNKEILDNTEKKIEENLAQNLEINENNIFTENTAKNLGENFNEDISIDNSPKLRSNKVKLNEIKNKERNNEQYIDHFEKYDDCENFIFLLRAQLINCFLSYRNNGDSILD